MESATDHAAVEQALQVTDAVSFRRPRFPYAFRRANASASFSRQLSRKGSETLLLDEPTTFLDLKHQLSMYRLLAELSQKLLVVTVTHDLNLALQFSSRILILDSGRLAGDGETAQVLNAESIERVFGVHARVSILGITPHMTYEA